MEEPKKVCFKCGRELPISEFYAHPGMRDGHLNKCKDCARNDVRVKYYKDILDPEYMEKERIRGREKYRKYHYNTADNRSEHFCKKNKLFPGLRDAKRIIGIKTEPGIELHHWNYNLLKSVILLPRIIHKRLHSRMSLDLDTGIYSYNGEVLDTMDKHLEVVKEVCAANGYDYNEIIIYNG